MCELPVGSGSDTVWWHSFESPSELEVAFRNIVEARQLPRGIACGPDVTAGYDRWELFLTFTGDRACYVDDEGAWAVWTYREPQILARAVRSDGDVNELDAWWNDVAKFLKNR